MISRIEMFISGYNVLIENNRKCFINDKECILKSDDIDNIVRIIRNWKYCYNNSKLFGESHYIIKVICANEEVIYKFNNDFPDNFLELVRYIGGMYAR